VSLYQQIVMCGSILLALAGLGLQISGVCSVLKEIRDALKKKA